MTVPEAGGVCVFLGVVRNNNAGRPVVALEYEAHGPMAEAKLKEIGYTGPLTIEREVALDQDMDDRHKEGLSHLDDILGAVRLLERLRGNPVSTRA